MNEKQPVNQRTDGTTPADTDYFGVDRLMGGGGYAGRKLSYLAVRTALASLWNSAISAAVSGLASTSYVTSAIATAVSGLVSASTMNAAIAASQVLTPSTPTRILNSNFTPSATKRVLCTYTISISCALSLSGGQTGAVELRSDTNATPTTARGRVAVTNSGTLIVGLAINNGQEAQLSYLCPPGHNVRLVSSGTATISITAQTEVAIG